MGQDDNGTPKPDPALIAVGVVAAATAEALADSRPAQTFIDSIERQAGDLRRRNAALTPGRRDARAMSQSARVAGRWLAALAMALRAALR
jgi:hypothetical protein